MLTFVSYSTSSSAMLWALTILWLIVSSLEARGTLVVEVCCSTCSNCCGCPPTAMHLSDGPNPSHSQLELATQPSCISSRKNFWTVSASLRSSNLESPALSLANFVSSFLQPILEVGVTLGGKDPTYPIGKDPSTHQRHWQCSGLPSSLHWGVGWVSKKPWRGSRRLFLNLRIFCLALDPKDFFPMMFSTSLIVLCFKSMIHLGLIWV